MGTSNASKQRPETGDERLRIVFILWAINFDRVFECVLREMLERGHEIEVLLDVRKSGMPASATRLLDSLEFEYPGFSYGEPLRRWHPWLRTATALRLGIDLLRYTTPEYERATALHERMRVRTPIVVRSVVRLGRRGPRWRTAIGVGLRALERSIPTPDDVVALIGGRRADVVLVSPVIGAGTPQVEYIRAAAELGIPSVLPVASWDNLTNKGVVKESPTLMLVWNEAQVDEAVRLHGIERDRVVVTGAHSYDHWFDWEPSTSRSQFAEKVGLNPDREFLLYVCSSGFIAGAEAHFIDEWLGHLRDSSDERLRNVGVIVRPHPQNVVFWREHDVDDRDRVVVWPREGAAPTDERRKCDYYDSIHHASAVIGINTSAQVEAAIVGRPVFTIVDDQFRETQEGTLHFAHLAGSSGDGMLVVARGWEQHLEQLARALAAPEAHRKRLTGFVESFARPYGLGVASAPKFADAVERVAAEGAACVRCDGPFTPIFKALTPLADRASRARARIPRRLRRRWNRRAARLVDRVRRVPQLALVPSIVVGRALLVVLPARVKARLPTRR